MGTHAHSPHPALTHPNRIPKSESRRCHRSKLAFLGNGPIFLELQRVLAHPVDLRGGRVDWIDGLGRPRGLGGGWMDLLRICLALTPTAEAPIDGGLHSRGEEIFDPWLHVVHEGWVVVLAAHQAPDLAVGLCLVEFATASRPAAHDRSLVPRVLCELLTISLFDPNSSNRNFRNHECRISGTKCDL